jgi:hypothetical protein
MYLEPSATNKILCTFIIPPLLMHSILRHIVSPSVLLVAPSDFYKVTACWAVADNQLLRISTQLPSTSETFTPSAHSTKYFEQEAQCADGVLPPRTGSEERPELNT